MNGNATGTDSTVVTPPNINAARPPVLQPLRPPVIVTLFCNFYSKNATFASNLFIQYHNANPGAAAALVAAMSLGDDNAVETAMCLLNALNAVDRNAVNNLMIVIHQLTHEG